MNTTDVPEVKPEKASEEIVVWLAVTASQSDGYPFVYANTEGSGMGDAETNARNSITAHAGQNSEYKRFAAVVKVRIPRALLREQWTGAKE